MAKRDLHRVQADGIRAVRRAGTEDALRRPRGVPPRGHAQHVGTRAIEPGEDDDLVAGPEALRPSSTSGSKTSQASGAPSSACRGVEARSVSEDSILPMGFTSNVVTFSSHRAG
jgi:hypothetical protein